MVERDRERFALLMTELFIAFRVEPTEPLMNVYWNRLKIRDIELFAKAVDEVIWEHTQFPPISTLYELSRFKSVKEITAQLCPSSKGVL